MHSLWLFNLEEDRTLWAGEVAFRTAPGSADYRTMASCLDVDQRGFDSHEWLAGNMG